jgi:hypothetical protein
MGCHFFASKNHKLLIIKHSFLKTTQKVLPFGTPPSLHLKVSVYVGPNWHFFETVFRKYILIQLIKATAKPS